MVFLPENETGCVAVHLFKNEKEPTMQWMLKQEPSRHPREFRAADCQVIELEFLYSQPRPFDEVKMRLEQVGRHLAAAEWMVSSPIDGAPKTGSSIEGVARQTATGFTVIAERRKPPQFDQGEIAQLTKLVGQLGETVFGVEVFLRE